MSHAQRAEAALLEDAEAAARAAGLRYVREDGACFVRKSSGRGFWYARANGTRVRDPRTLARIQALAIPPAWTDVRISADARGHLQATGRDARGRKQYRYHGRFRSVRDGAKFAHLVDFAAALPAIRRRVARDLHARGLPPRRVVAAVVRLLDATLVRIGSVEYARDNDSFGLTTLRERHVSIRGRSVEIAFRGKGGKQHRVRMGDARLVQVLQRCIDLPGRELFVYRDAEGRVQRVLAQDVNDYLREAGGCDVTSKDFRTWGATVATALELHAAGDGEGVTERKRRIVRAIAGAAVLLGNTPAVCRRSYVHPRVLACYLDGGLGKALGGRAAGPAGLDRQERLVLRLLRSTPGVSARSRPRRRGGPARRRRRAPSRRAR